MKSEGCKMYEIREYNVNDKEQVVKLWLDVCVEEHGYKDWKEGMEELEENEYEKILVAVCDEKIVGTMAYKKVNDEAVELKRVYLYPEHRGKGIAKKLYDSILDIIKTEEKYKEILAETWENFQSGINFYYKNNFELRLQEAERYVFALSI